MSSKISEDRARKFCELCDWTYQCWATRKELDDNPKRDITLGKVPAIAYMLSAITQEYVLLQICKLHDRGDSNLTIDYIVRHGNWGTEEKQIKDIKKRLDTLNNHLVPARHKLICHNDLKTITGNSNTALGAFPEGLDEKYFEALQALVNMVSAKWLGCSVYPFNNLAKADVKEFLDVLLTST